MNDIRLKAPVELKVAADASMMLVIRLTAAGVLARAGLTIDDMENHKIATEEACNCLINQQCPPENLALFFGCEENRLLIRVTAEGGDCKGDMDETELEIVKCILESLTDEVGVNMQDGRLHSIELRADLG